MLWHPIYKYEYHCYHDIVISALSKHQETLLFTLMALRFTERSLGHRAGIVSRTLTKLQLMSTTRGQWPSTLELIVRCIYITYCIYNVWYSVIQSDLYYPRFLRSSLSTPNLCKIQSDLHYSHLYYPRNSIIRGFWDQNLVRPSTADNRGMTVLLLIS